MYSCGDVGKERGDEVLIRVPLRLNEKTPVSHSGDEGKIRAGNIVGVLRDVNQTCFDYRREVARRTVCRVSGVLPRQQYHGLTFAQIAAQTLIREKDYGLAVSYCSSAEDWRGLGRVVDRVLEEYIISGKSFLLFIT
jgi:nuclear pore complex protein Nup85